MNLSSDDGMYIQYSVDTGQTWLTLGSVGDPNGTNWYNDNSLGNGEPGFTGNNAPWDSSSYQLSALNFEPLVQFRFVFYSNSFTTADGISIDDVSITPPPAYEAEMTELISPIDGCGLNNAEVVTVKIKNKGTNQINGGINVSYQVLGDPVVTESISTTIDAGDSLNYPFTATIDMSVTTHDSLFNITAWVDLTGDPIQSNDTIVTDVLSGYVPDDPIVSNVTIPYGTNTTLSASTLAGDTLFMWFDVPTGGTEIGTGTTYTTPILYDTTVYWVETRTAGPDIKFTEIVQYEIGTGATSPYPTYCDGDDYLEIANLGSGTQDLSNWTIEVYGSAAGSYTFPAGITVDANEVVVLSRGGSGTNDPGNNYYESSLPSTSSGVQNGYVLKDDAGNIVDVVAMDGYAIVGNGGVTSSDWTGSIPSSSSMAGVYRTISDNNNASDWLVAHPVKYRIVPLQAVVLATESLTQYLLLFQLLMPALLL